jgi:hypothetical protein
MKISTRVLKNIIITIVIFAIYNQILCSSNLKENSNKKKQVTDKNSTPPKDTTPSNDDPKFNIKTAIYVIQRAYTQMKQLKNDQGPIYDQCGLTCISPSAINAMKNLWKYLDSVDFSGKEDLKKDAFDKFCVEAMGDEKLIVNKVKLNCEDICKNVSVKTFDDNMQKDLRAIFSPYFAAIDFGGSKKNIITAFIGTYRDTDLGRALPRKLNRDD